MYTICLKRQIRLLTRPVVMAIVNATPDSFFAGSRASDADALRRRIDQCVQEGADWLDVGGCSTRPGAEVVSAKEEWNRIEPALDYIRSQYPDKVVSVDTFRSEITRKAKEQYAVDIINDISAGEMDADMFDAVAESGCVYVLMHMRGIPSTMLKQTDYNHLLADITSFFADKMNQLNRLGVKDILLDPGFGFAKNTEQNLLLLKQLHCLHVFEKPLLVGVSRKRMIQETAGCTAEDALYGTVAANTLALKQGATILRVHDVKAARQACLLVASAM